jgi:L-alanine-DL-glutamate epimerase-like enolase superfamily enzyme
MAMATETRVGIPVERVSVSAYTVPTDQPESDGTLAWQSTTLILVEVEAAGETGLGYTYGHPAVGQLIHSELADLITGADALSPQAVWAAMQESIRNIGQPGLAAMAVSAVDIALWDLKARLLGLCLADLLGRFRKAAPVYGSGGFTSYSDARLAEQLEGWVERGIPRVKIKVGRNPDEDPHRLAVAREAIGEDTSLFVDANGAFTPKEALHWAGRYSDFGVSYFEEPVSSEDRDGLRLVRDHAPAGMAIAAGEYGWTLADLAALAGCVDVLQADVSRCGGITSLLRVDGICKARNLPLSAHCVPAVSAHAGCALECLVHVEYFHDHVRVERLLFDGVLEPDGGVLRPDRSRPGIGLELKRADAREYEV